MINLDRPKIFNSFYGQKDIIEILKNQLEKNKIYHCYLFSGFKGVGKTSLAKIFASSINCKNFLINKEPCSSCNACLNPMDIIEIDGGIYKGKEQMVELMDRLLFAPLFGKKKILILDEVHKLTSDAFTSILKFIEEPPKHLILILVTNLKKNLPKVIISRCFSLNLNTFNKKEIIDFINYKNKSTFKYTQDVYNYIYKQSEGSIRDAYLLAENFSIYEIKIPDSLINFETKKNFEYLITLKEKEDFLKFCLDISIKADLRSFFIGFKYFYIDRNEYMIAFYIEKILLKYEIYSSYYLVLAGEIFDYLFKIKND